MDNPQPSESKTKPTSFFRIIQALEKSPTVSYVLNSDHKFIYCNPAWDRFARVNGAPSLRGDSVVGSDFFTAIPDPLRRFFAEAFDKARGTRNGWECSYECSSPGLFRKYRMRIHFMENRDWFLITNPLIFERPHRNMVKADSKKYVQDNGLIMMCVHCRCSNRVDIPNQWDFVPEYIHLTGKASLQISHGFCPICHAYFYPA
jgi:hypothetical protein